MLSMVTIDHRLLALIIFIGPLFIVPICRIVFGARWAKRIGFVVAGLFSALFTTAVGLLLSAQIGPDDLHGDHIVAGLLVLVSIWSAAGLAGALIGGSLIPQPKKPSPLEAKCPS